MTARWPQKGAFVDLDAFVERVGERKISLIFDIDESRADYPVNKWSWITPKGKFLYNIFLNIFKVSFDENH